MDDILIDRLAKPVDHSVLKKRILMEQKADFLRSRPPMLTRSRSRSTKKLVHDDRSYLSKYKTFVSRIGKGDSDDEDQWRGANDFTRLSSFQQKDGAESSRSARRKRSSSQQKL